MSRNASRLKEFEISQARDRRRRELEWQYEEGGYGYEAPRRLSRNTLGPLEDVVERRRRNRKHVAMAVQPGGGSRHVLAENVIFLILLVGSIYGMYRLCLHILNP